MSIADVMTLKYTIWHDTILSGPGAGTGGSLNSINMSLCSSDCKSPMDTSQLKWRMYGWMGR